MHVEQVLGDVPREERCKCNEKRATAPRQGPEPSLWKRLFG
jgi:hypothetical protein